MPRSINFSISVSVWSRTPIGILSGQVRLILQFGQWASQSFRELPDAYVSSIYNKLPSVPVFANQMPRSVSNDARGQAHLYPNWTRRETYHLYRNHSNTFITIGAYYCKEIARCCRLLPLLLTEWLVPFHSWCSRPTSHLPQSDEKRDVQMMWQPPKCFHFNRGECCCKVIAIPCCVLRCCLPNASLRFAAPRGQALNYPSRQSKPSGA